MTLLNHLGGLKGWSHYLWRAVDDASGYIGGFEICRVKFSIFYDFAICEVKAISCLLTVLLPEESVFIFKFKL